MVIVNLCKDTPIYLSNGKEEVTKTMRELLPMSFDEEDVL
jgi:cytidine deaminase